MTEDDDYVPFRYFTSINGILDKKQIKNWTSEKDFDGSFVTTIKKLDSKDFIIDKEQKKGQEPSKQKFALK